jgi:hypothetical protein
MVRVTSSVVLALLLTVVSGCRGSAATPPPTPELNVAPMPSSGTTSSSLSSSVSSSSENASTTAESEAQQLPESERPQGDACGLTATIRSVPGSGGSPRFAVTLTNKGRKPARLVVPGDGSEAGMRTPILTWIATAGGNPAEPAPPSGRCGLTNAIEAKEVFTLAPGASREMNEWLGEPYVKPGTYDVKLRFRNDPKVVRNASPDVTKLVAATDACDVTSNAIKVTIKGP